MIQASPLTLGERAFQEAFARFLTDPAFRAAVQSGESVWLGLDPDIERRLLALDGERTGVFAELLVANRIAKIREALPNTAALLGEDLVSIGERFNREEPSRDPRKFAEAMSFTGYLQRVLGTEAIGPACLPDVLEFETVSLRLRYQYRLPLWPDEVGEPEAMLAALRMGECMRVHRHPFQALLRLSYDLEWICDEIAEGRDPSGVGPSPTAMLMYVTEDGVLERLILSEPTLEFLSRADGALLDSIVEELAKMFHQVDPTERRELETNVRALCGALIERSVIRLSRARDDEDHRSSREVDGLSRGHRIGT